MAPSQGANGPAISVLRVWAGRSLLGGAWHAGARTAGGRGRCHRRRPRLAHVDQTVGEFSGFALHMSQDNAPGRWTPSPLLYASGAVHLGAAAAVLARPRAWPWALGALAANHFALAAAGLWPRSQLLGPNWTRLPAQSGVSARAAITIDDGPDPAVTPRVLAQLAEHGAHATFFCVGFRVERYADLAREIVS